jgi:hypothetical protein
MASYDAETAAGSARTTSSDPGGSDASRGRTRWRRRRRTLLRTTALPTVLDTTKPARAGEACAGSSRSRWTTTVPRPTRRPPRTAAAKSVLRRSRCAAASTTTCHSAPTSLGSCRQLVAALGAASGDNGTAGPGTHAQPETVGLRAPTVVRLVGALAHVRNSVFVLRPGGTDSRTPLYQSAEEQPPDPTQGTSSGQPSYRSAGRHSEPYPGNAGLSARPVNLFLPGSAHGGGLRLKARRLRC